jgi:hypothetical protein
MVGDATEDVSEVVLGVDVVELGGFDQGVHCRGASAAGVGTGKEVILAADGYSPYLRRGGDD